MLRPSITCCARTMYRVLLLWLRSIVKIAVVRRTDQTCFASYKGSFFSFSIVMWSYMLPPPKHPGEIIGIVISHTRSDFSDGVVTVIQQVFRFLNSNLVDIVGERHPQCLFEGAGKMGWVDAKYPGKAVQACRLINIEAKIGDCFLDDCGECCY